MKPFTTEQKVRMAAEAGIPLTEEQVSAMLAEETQSNLCASGRHAWGDPEDRRRCCAGFHRVQALSRADLEDVGAEHIVHRQLWRGWRRDT